MRMLRVLLEKEFLQFLRNPFLPRMALVFPAMVMLVFPWVTTMDVRHIGVAVVDNDRTITSRRLISKIGASDYYTLQEITDDFAGALNALESGIADVILEIPDGFEEGLSSDNPKKTSISANGVNATKGSLGTQYLQQTLMATLAELQAERGAAPAPETIVVQNRYNPTLEYRNYMIPALMIMLLITLGGFLPALNLVNEKETGTIEQINVTPVSRLSFTLAKLVLYWIIGFVVLTLALLLAWIVYGLVPVGAAGAIYLASMLFVLVMSGFGVIVANYSSTILQAIFVMFFFVMIFILMSGLLTPIASMPSWAQCITYFLPPRYFIEIMRAVYLKGATLRDLWYDYAALALFAAVFNTAAALTYKKQL